MANANWEPRAINKNWGPGLVNINSGPGPVNTNLGPVNTKWGPGQGAGGGDGGQGHGRRPSKGRGSREIKTPLDFTVLKSYLEIS